MKPSFNLLILTVILLLSAFLRIVYNDDYGVGGDEKNSLFVSQGVSMEGANQADVFFKKDSPYFTPKDFSKPKYLPDFYDAIARCDNGSSALHSGLLWYWSNAFGVDDGTLRWFSALWGLLFVAFLYFFVNQHFKAPNMALMVAFMAAIEPCFVEWSRFVRTYSLSFFCCLVATHLLLKIINENKNRWYYVAYSLMVFVCMMCHYANFTLFVVHGILVLLYSRQLKTWLGLAGAMAMSVLAMLWWLTAGGGQYAVQFMKGSAEIYNNMAAQSPVIGYLAPTTLKNVVIQMIPILGNHFLSSNGLYDALLGYKNILLAIVLALLCIGVYKSNLKIIIKQVVVLVLFVGSFFVFTVAKIQFLLLAVNIILGIVLVEYLWKNRKEKIVMQSLILAVLPLLFLIMFAFQDGNTFRIQQKYTAYAMPFSLILLALVFRFIMQNYEKWASFLLVFAMFGQSFFVGQTLISILKDQNPRYTFTKMNRQLNPHREAARQIVKTYMAGDTVLLPSYKGQEEFGFGGVDLPSYSIKDAQLINIYLPKKAEYIERIDRSEPNKVILKKANGQKVILFDFEGQKYRY